MGSCGTFSRTALTDELEEQLYRTGVSHDAGFIEGLIERGLVRAHLVRGARVVLVSIPRRRW